MTRKALITGVTGQDGSYLAELLVEKGYEVFGLVRRASTVHTPRLDAIYQEPQIQDRRLELIYGDMLDATCLERVVRDVQPDEVYNLAAQSHVGVSFDMPEYTVDVVALGTLRLLEAVRLQAPNARFYQASSSEMFGDVVETPQRETTPFRPQSPYACAKVYAYHQTINYRKAYGVFATNGVLFNHECVDERTPLLVRRDGAIEVVRVADLVPLRRKGPSTQQFELSGLEVWDGQAWTDVRCITATARRTRDPQHVVRSIQTRAGSVDVTSHHRMIRSDGSVYPAVEVAVGDRLALATSLPDPTSLTVVSAELAELLGLLAADGYVPERGRLQFTNNDPTLRDRVAELWRRLFLGTSSAQVGCSGFDPERPVHQLYLRGAASLCEWLRGQLYTRDGFKQIPPIVLNATPEVQGRFLAGYYAGDGLKAGNGDAVKTNSPVLALGLVWLYAVQGRSSSVYLERRDGRTYYQLNLASANPLGQKGQHLRKDPAEVRRVDEVTEDAPTWVFDLETGSGVFCAGVGRVVVHNSPRRGETFVTRKVTRAAARIKHGLQRKLFLGNLEARRDWGYAPEFVDAMWRMLQADAPDDYVVATGETRSVRELVEEAFGHLELDWREHVEVDPRYIRPAEVNLLCGDPTKAREQLGWEPKVTFRELVRIMVEADLELARAEAEKPRRR